MTLGASTEFAASQAAEAQARLAQAGFSVNEVLGATPGVLALASAGQLSMGESAGFASSVLRAFNLEIDQTNRVADVLAATATSTNSTVRTLGEGMKQVAPVASLLNIDLETTSAALGLLQNAGLGATQSGTVLRGTLASLLAPSGEARKALAAVGVSIDEVSKILQSGDLVGAFQLLFDAQVDAGTAARVYGREAQAGATILTQQRDRLSELAESYKEAQGAAEGLRNVQNQGIVGAFRELRSVFEGVQLSLGDSGITLFLQRAAEGATILLRAFNAAPGPIKVVTAGLIVLGPFILAAGIGLQVLAFSARFATGEMLKQNLVQLKSVAIAPIVTVKTLGLAAANRVLAVSLRSVLIAAGPIGILIVGLGYAFDAFGVRTRDAEIQLAHLGNRVIRSQQEFKVLNDGTVEITENLEAMATAASTARNEFLRLFDAPQQELESQLDSLLTTALSRLDARVSS